MRKLISILLTLLIIAGISVPVYAASKTELEAAINKTASFLINTVQNPQVDSVGGEWVVIGLARSGVDVPDSYFENYFRTVERHVRARDGVLHNRRLTDYSRVILALTAAGFDPRNVAGYDLTLPLGDFDRVIWQGINGPIFALLALDSINYAVPENRNAVLQATRELFIAEILRRQTSDGGWNLGAGADGVVAFDEKGDPDITAMALQALAKYRGRGDVNLAIERALIFISNIQDSNGGFSGTLSGDASDVESAAQMLIALGELGIPFNDSRFVKNGNTIVDNILSYRVDDGSFMHSHDGTGNNQMSTEQAFLGLVAAQRSLDGRNSLYRMADAVRRGSFSELPGNAAVIGLTGKHDDVAVRPVVNPGRTFTDIRNHPSQTAIEALAERDIISGMTETTFAPDQTMTRAEFAAIITRGLGLPRRTGTSFTDVQSGAWFAVPIATAFYYDIVRGTSTTTFNPHGTITRQEAAVMIMRAAGLAGVDTELTEIEVRNLLAAFGDHRQVAIWAQNALAFCYIEGILDDYDFYIEPGRAIRRSEVAEMLYRLLGLANLLHA